MITPDFETDNLKELSKVFDAAAIHARRCEKCGKVYYVNLDFDEHYKCHHCRYVQLNQGGV